MWKFLFFEIPTVLSYHLVSLLDLAFVIHLHLIVLSYHLVCNGNISLIIFSFEPFKAKESEFVPLIAEETGASILTPGIASDKDLHA